MKRIVFVAHEFGLYTGHGGIASYLYNITKYLLEETDYEINIMASRIDEKCDLLPNSRLILHRLFDRTIKAKRQRVLQLCQKLSPEYVEFAEFEALGLDCVLAKVEKHAFSKTLLITNSHTATKECYEWSAKKKITSAPLHSQALAQDEEIQLQLSDYCFSPSVFLAKYIKKNYNLKEDVLVFPNPYFYQLASKKELATKLNDCFDLNAYESSFNIVLITRLEGRKSQIDLVNAVMHVLKETDFNVKLFLVGGTATDQASGKEYRLQVYEAIEPEFLENFYFYDFLTISEQEKLVAIADLTIMPSVFENQPVAMIESVLRGIPVIASRYSGCADYAPDKMMLFDPFLENDLAKKIIWFIKMSKIEREKLADAQSQNLRMIIDPNVSIMPRFELPLKDASQLPTMLMEDLYNEE